MAMTSENQPDKYKKNVCVGLLAHVDAGKTTLSESLLYLSGSIRKLGRVDHRDAFLDTNELERSRGITIFSKQAVFELGNFKVTLMDTPGHVDFSAEMERTLQVLDYAILVISGADGVQGHTQTLWRLLQSYEIPTFIFVNKMDQPGTERQSRMEELRQRLGDGCIDFTREGTEEFFENLAVCDEEALEQYLDKGSMEGDTIARLIRERRTFPCYFGSALKLEGVEAFLQGLKRYIIPGEYPSGFGARVFKITRDDQGNRLTFLKVTGGELKVKDVLTDRGDEKADQIRVYSGARYEMVPGVPAGAVCGVTGLNSTYPGQGLGEEAEGNQPLLEPVLVYRILLPEGCHVHNMLLKLRQLEEEEPQLHIEWNEQLEEIHAQVMGEVQIEVLRSLILERFGTEVEFDTGDILYKETIASPVEGVGHFEPLRHYAEVHLLLEPGERNSGMVFDTDCSEDVLDGNWQRLVLTHLMEKEQPGVLIGAPITDMKITLIAGRAHLKHTEGGDFRQATYRAVRHGLKKAETILLEPYYQFTLEVPSEQVGRAMSDIQKRQGSFEPPVIQGEMSVLTGKAPVITMRDYQTEMVSYTGGRGRIFYQLSGYEPCHNSEEVKERRGYDSEKDLENPTGSVFCAHGAGFVVKWDQVEEYMHLQNRRIKREPEKERRNRGTESQDVWASEKELEEIFVRTYGPVKRERQSPSQRIIASGSQDRVPAIKKKEQPEAYLLVDGYNIIFAWEDLRELAEVNLEGARNKLMDILCNYQGFIKCHLILVFDAYKVKGNPGEVVKYHNIYVVYTREAETADQYIEKTVHQLGRKYDVTVATSDALEQMIILGQGGQRLSAQGLLEEIEEVNRQLREDYLHNRPSKKNYLFDYLPEELAELMESVRLGRKKL